MRHQTTNYTRFIHSWVFGLEVLESLGVRSVLARVRIGHTHLTLCFPLKGEDPPQCTACDCQLTVKHILFECNDFIESRNRHFSVNSFKELFEKVQPDSILSYLHEIGLFYRL